MWQYDGKTNSFIAGRLPADGAEITALYGRLSQEDTIQGDSESIINQRDFLWKYAQENNLPNPRLFLDDGFSGTNFDRPGYKEMVSLLDEGLVTTIIVKDHSRLGRNRLVVGALMDRFAEEGIRYIAVTDGIDSAQGLDDMVAFRELFNEFYPRDTSKKVKAVFASKGNNGQRLCTFVPYGYKGDKYGWEIDPEAAKVVQKIFSLCMEGLGPTQIAKRLQMENILTPRAHRHTRHAPTRYQKSENPYEWSESTISGILERIEYTGCTSNFKTIKKSYKSKKILRLPMEERKIFADTQPAIIDQDTWDRVQELRKNKRRPTKAGKYGLFSGLVFCADCGSKLYFCTTKSFTDNQDHYVCSNYKSNTGTCAAHYIRESVLREIVLNHLRQTILYVQDNEDEFVRSLVDRSMEEQQRSLTQKQKTLVQLERRIAELDTLFQRIYEDNVVGKLSDERFTKLSITYETEQRELRAKVQDLQATLNKSKESMVNITQFVALVKKYTEVSELTPTILNEFIQKVIIHCPEKVFGKRQQKIQIVYNFVGEVETLQNTKNDKVV